ASLAVVAVPAWSIQHLSGRREPKEQAPAAPRVVPLPTASAALDTSPPSSTDLTSVKPAVREIGMQHGPAPMRAPSPSEPASGDPSADGAGEKPPAPSPASPPNPGGTGTEAAHPAGDGARPTPGAGRLTVNAMPWAAVSVDGAAAGNTPLRSFALSPGAHVIALS